MILRFAVLVLALLLPLNSYVQARGFSGRPYHPGKGWKVPGTKRPHK